MIPYGFIRLTLKYNFHNLLPFQRSLLILSVRLGNSKHSTLWCCFSSTCSFNSLVTIYSELFIHCCSFIYACRHEQNLKNITDFVKLLLLTNDNTYIQTIKQFCCSLVGQKVVEFFSNNEAIRIHNKLFVH